MIKRLLLVIAGLSFSVYALAACESEEKSAKYHGALFDAMAQIDRGMYDQVLAKMDKSGVQGMALFGRLTHKSNGDVDVQALKKNFPQKFIIGTPKWFDLRDDVSALYLRQTLSGLRDGPYQFVGEIMFAHGDKSHGEQTASGERFVSADKPNVMQLMQELQVLQAPVMTHWEVYNWNRDWPVFHALYGKFPQLTFIWPHAGFGSAAQAETVLSQHENVVISLSKTEKDQRSLSSEEKSAQLGGAMVDDCGVILPEWRALLDRFPTRFMFATDAHKDFRWNKYGHIISRWRQILGQLPDEQAQLIAWKNAERVYGKPR